MNLCKYKNLFGQPETGVHSFRIFNIGVIDVLVTLLCAAMISKVFSFSLKWTIIYFFIFGIFVHRLLCVRTTIDKLLFPNPTYKFMNFIYL
jgi:hypothetical protein